MRLLDNAWCTFWRSLHVLLSLVGNGLGSEVCSNLFLDLVQIYQISWCNFPIIRDMHMSRFAQDDQFSLKHPLSSTCYFEEFLSTIEHVAGPRPLQSFVGNLHGSLPSRWRLRSFIQRVLAQRCFVWILGTVKLQKFTFRKLNWKLKKCLPPFQFPHKRKKRFQHICLAGRGLGCQRRLRCLSLLPQSTRVIFQWNS